MCVPLVYLDLVINYWEKCKLLTGSHIIHPPPQTFHILTTHALGLWIKFYLGILLEVQFHYLSFSICFMQVAQFSTKLMKRKEYSLFNLFMLHAP